MKKVSQKEILAHFESEVIQVAKERGLLYCPNKVFQDEESMEVETFIAELEEIKEEMEMA